MTIPDLPFAAVAQCLIDWHSQAQRSLPWRGRPAGQRDPYAVWVSETMLQQTRVETAVAFYERWMARFPTIQALAAADQQEVLKLWEGLGYYARARNLHRAAQEVAARGGQMPDRRADLLKLPGIGRYTAGAILSLAFGQAEPAVDGNAARVLSRLADLDQPIDQPATIRQLWDLARALVESAPAGAAGLVNEGIMELGATLCVPATPRCAPCPLADLCLAAQRGVQSARPVTSPRRRTPHYDVTAGVIWQGEPHASRLLIAQRPQTAMLGGLWEFPGGKRQPDDEDLAACLRREIAEELGITIAVGEPVTTVRHAYTHFRITLHAFHAHHIAGEPQAIGCADWRWVGLDELDAFPFPVTDQKIIAALRSQAKQLLHDHLQ